LEFAGVFYRPSLKPLSKHPGKVSECDAVASYVGSLLHRLWLITNRVYNRVRFSKKKQRFIATGSRFRNLHGDCGENPWLMDDGRVFLGTLLSPFVVTAITGCRLFPLSKMVWNTAEHRETKI